MARRIYLQLFAAKQNSTTYSGSHTQEESQGGSSSSTVGGSSTHSETNTQGGSHTEGQSHSYSTTTGNSSSISTGKTWASGKVDDNIQAAYDKNNSMGYTQSDKVSAAYDALQQTLSQTPTFQSKYEDKMAGLYDQIMNRPEFSYNFNEDAYYQNALNQYKTNGKTAMQDTLGIAQAANGGYGSSYAQSAGQQTYQNYLQEATNMINDYRNAARADYDSQNQDLMNKFNLTNSMYEQEYGQYRDQMADWQSDRAFNQSAYADERNFDWNQYTADRDYTQQQYWNMKNSEQSNYQASNTWYQENSQTDTYSSQDTNYWENSVTDSETNYWSNTDSSNWSNANSYTGSFSQTLANAQAASGYTGGTKNTGNSMVDLTGYYTNMNKVNDIIKGMGGNTSYLANANTNEQLQAMSNQNVVTDDLKKQNVPTSSSLYQNGAVHALDNELSGLSTDKISEVIKDMAQNPEEYGLSGTKQELEWVTSRYSSSKLETILGKALYQKLFG